MNFPRDAKRDFFCEVYNQLNQYLGAMYHHYSARKWAIKEYPGQWFESGEEARAWLMIRNQPTVKG